MTDGVSGRTRLVPIPDGLDGSRLDSALARLFGLSRTVAAGIIDRGEAAVDGRTAIKSTQVAAGSLVEVLLPAAPSGPTADPEPVPGLRVIHADDAILVIDKPVGVAVHPSPGWSGPTVTAGLAAMGYRLATSGAAERQGIVHRLDAGTTGLMVVARSERAYTVLKQAFRERTVEKNYHALVQGHPDPLRGTIDAPIDRRAGSDFRFGVVAGGRPSVTHYETLEAFRAASLLDVTLETGRTHQIRVHMAALRHPCVGDRTYGADPTLAADLGLQRQWLHARRLAFVHPEEGGTVSFESPYPDDLAAAVDRLRAAS